MSEMVERVMATISPLIRDTNGLSVARAAIAAMREPTRAMVMAGKDIPTDDHEEDMWKAMIDAALSEEVKA